MTHYIRAEQLSGKHIYPLALSSEDLKRLDCVVDIIAERFTSKTVVSFRVLHNNSIVHVSDTLQLAIKAYNKIQTSNKLAYNNYLAGLDKAQSCHDCAKQDNCNLFMRKGNQPTCVNYKPE